MLRFEVPLTDAAAIRARLGLSPPQRKRLGRDASPERPARQTSPLVQESFGRARSQVPRCPTPALPTPADPETQPVLLG